MLKCCVVAVIFVIALGECDEISAPGNQMVSSNNEFALDLYRTLSRVNGRNVFFSPLSISVAVAMTSLGARGNTLNEIDRAFHFDKIKKTSTDPMIVHELFQALIKSVEEEHQGYNLKVANRLFAQENIELLKNFVEAIPKYYQADVIRVDFGSGHAESIINQWIEQKTSGKIQNLFEPGSITPDSALVLVNTIYFKGIWKVKFDNNKTTEMDFHVSLGAKKIVDMMSVTADYPYVEDKQLRVKVLELPYAGDDVSMIVLLPELGEIRDFIANLTASKLNHLLTNLRTREVDVQLPKFKLETKYSLKETLQELGVSDLFSDSADLEGMSPYPLKVTQAVHKAIIEVDEDGTRAAAASGFGLAPFSGINNLQKTSFHANRPFLFLIINNKHFPQIVFIGSVINP